MTKRAHIVRAHTRRTKHGRTTVRAHTRGSGSRGVEDPKRNLEQAALKQTPKRIWKQTDFRMFNGKKFHIWADHDPVSKTWAIGITRHWRRKGFHARMIAVKNGYVIFKRKKGK